jgi:uncharacterized repeat protein (TIGR02543 family)
LSLSHPRNTLISLMMRIPSLSSGRKVFAAFLTSVALTLASLTPIGAGQAARAATITGITSKAALVSAISSAVAGDTLVLGSDIIVDTSAISINKAITIDGNGYTATVPNVGVLDDGTNSSSASTWGVFAFTTGSTNAVITNMSIKGGNSTTGAISVGAGLTVTVQNCTVSNSRNSSGGGGGIKNSGTLYLRDSNVVRNSARYGGGFQNSSVIYISGTSFSDNRSEGSGAGGGAGENTGGGSYLYVNNSTFANNVSSEIGGAINNYMGTLYATNSTFTGNVTLGYSTYGGAIGKNGGTVKVASSLFAYNYSITAGTSASPSAYQLDDIDYGAVTLAYSMYHGVVYSSGSTLVRNTQYTAAADGANDTIFSGGTNGKVTNGSGIQVGTATVFRPALTTVNGRRVVAIKTGSLPIGIGAPTYYRLGAANMSYYDRLAPTPAWVSMVGSANSSDLVTTDQLGVTRSSTTPTAGAVETGAAALYVVKSIATADGTVDGGASIYGNTYANGSSVTVTALPNAGKVFSKWQVVVGGAASVDITSNPYTFNVSANTTLTPVFANAPVNTYTVTYSANGATAGSPPSAQTFTVGGSAIVTSPNSGSLDRSGYSFGGWSTASSGSGTIYVAGTGSFTPSANTTLYAYWVPPSVPSIAVGSASYSLTTGTSATISPTNSGGSASSWSISPSAPAGMTFGTSTGVLSGAPTTAQSSTNYTITATNVAGSATATFSIAIAEPVATYTVTYNYNSATGGNSTTSASFTVGGSAVTLPTPTKTGYTFGGWYSDSGLTASAGSAGASYSPSANVTLYAKWIGDAYAVTYNYNSATGGNSTTSASFTVGSSALTLPTPTKTGYTFGGWYSDAGLTTSVGSAGASYSPSADLTLYAKWTAYNYSGATGGNSTPSAAFTVGGSAITLPTPTRTNFVFDGWFDALSGGNLIGAAAATLTPSASVTIYARWTQASLSGIAPGDLVSVGSLVASDSLAVDFGASANGSSVHVAVPAGSLPNGTTISLNLLNNFTHAQSAITGAHDYVLSLVVSWLTTDGFVPTTNAGKPIAMTITNSAIKRGDAIYVLVHGVATMVGRATVDGQALVEITDDPEIVIASTRPFAVTNVTATDGDDGSSTISWTAPSIDGGSTITGYTVTSSGGQTCTVTTTTCTITGLTNGTSYTFNVVATNGVGNSTAVTSSSITPAAAVNNIQNVTPPVSTPVTPPVTTPPVTQPVVTPPVTAPVEPPVVAPEIPAVTPVPPVTTPTKPLAPAAKKVATFTSSTIGQKLTGAQVARLKALKATKGFIVSVFTRALLDAGSQKAMQKIAARVSGAIKSSFVKSKLRVAVAGLSKTPCKSPSGVCIAITATK